MAKFPKISAVIPTYGQASYLEACLDSVYFQDYPNLEIIVVADPSPDETSGILEQYRRNVESQRVDHAARYDEEADAVLRASLMRYPREGRELVIVENAERLGHTPSYNLGFSLSSGEYCTYVASDDLCHPQMFSTLAAPLIHGEADFVYSDMFVVDDAGRILREFKLPDYDFRRSFCDWYLCGVSKLYRRALHEEFGWYDNDYLANDHELYLRFALGGVRFLHVPKTLYSVRTHDNREVDVHSVENYKRMIEESKELVRRARAALEKASHNIRPIDSKAAAEP